MTLYLDFLAVKHRNLVIQWWHGDSYQITPRINRVASILRHRCENTSPFKDAFSISTRLPTMVFNVSSPMYTIPVTLAMPGYQGPRLLTWFNFNPSMDK